MVRRLDTAYSTLVWSADGTQLTKTRPAGDYPKRRFRNELRVSRLLTACPPPVPTPALLGFESRTRSLTFEAVPGVQINEKYPSALAAADIDAILELGRALSSYTPRRRWLRRLNTERRLALARNRGLLDPRSASALVDVARRYHRTRHFAHGDLTARNVLRCDDGLVLIDWEWAGLYPPGYDDAFLWLSLQDVEGGRACIEPSVRVDEKAFLLSALLVELWHLQWYVPNEFLPRHLATRDELLGRLLA